MRSTLPKKCKDTGNRNIYSALHNWLHIYKHTEQDTLMYADTSVNKGKRTTHHYKLVRPRHTSRYERKHLPMLWTYTTANYTHIYSTYSCLHNFSTEKLYSACTLCKGKDRSEQDKSIYSHLTLYLRCSSTLARWGTLWAFRALLSFDTNWTMRIWSRVDVESARRTVMRDAHIRFSGKQAGYARATLFFLRL